MSAQDNALPVKLGQYPFGVAVNGAYHYHAVPTGLLNNLTGGKPRMVLAGWAADGFPIYGPWA